MCTIFFNNIISRDVHRVTGPGSATITDSTQTLYIDLPNTIANITDVVVSGNVQGNAVIGNLSGDFGYVLANTSSGNGNINANNITLTGALAASNVSGNGAGLSAIAGSNVTGQVANALVAGTVYTLVGSTKHNKYRNFNNTRCSSNSYCISIHSKHRFILRRWWWIIKYRRR